MTSGVVNAGETVPDDAPDEVKDKASKSAGPREPSWWSVTR